MTNREVPTGALNTFDTRNRNLAAVYEAIRETKAISRTEIGANMPFSLQTVTSVCQELLAMGLIRVGERLAPKKGKPQTALHIVADRGYSLGVQLRWNSISLCLVDLGYNIIEQRAFDISAFEPRQYVAEVLSIIRTYMGAHADKDFWALGLSAPLAVGTLRGMSLLRHTKFAWKDAEWFESLWSTYSIETLRAEFEDAVGLPTVLLNNPQSAALAESIHMPLDASMVYIMVGLGLGAAFVRHRALSDQLWRSSGEIGYVIYKDEPLGRLFSVSGLREHLGLRQSQGEYEPVVADAFSTRRADLESWFDGSAERLRLIVNFLENTMRPDSIVLGGFLPSEYLNELLRRTAPLPRSVVLDEDDADRTMPRLCLASRSFESISQGAGMMTLSYRANPDFSTLIGRRRSH